MHISHIKVPLLCVFPPPARYANLKADATTSVLLITQTTFTLKYVARLCCEKLSTELGKAVRRS